MKNTGRVKAKMMIFACQHRKHHADTYYASATLRYQKEFAVKLSDVTFACEEDKHTNKSWWIQLSSGSS